MIIQFLSVNIIALIITLSHFSLNYYILLYSDFTINSLNHLPLISKLEKRKIAINTKVTVNINQFNIPVTLEFMYVLHTILIIV